MPIKEIIVIAGTILLGNCSCKCLEIYDLIQKIQIEDQYVKMHSFSPREARELPLRPDEIRDGLNGASNQWSK